MNKLNNQKGQVALVLVLVMTVVSALAVSLASRSTVDTRIQQIETASVQALTYAQTGIERLVLSPESSTVSDANFLSVKTQRGEEFFETGRVDSGSTVEVNLTGALNLTGFSVYWKPDVGSVGKKPAVFVSLLNDNGVVKDEAYDYDGVNGFTAGQDGSSEGYEKKTQVVALSSDIKMIRITTLGCASLLKIIPVGGLFPAQVVSIKSIGSVMSDANSIKYGLQYDESSSDTVPGVFDYALFSGGSINQ